MKKILVFISILVLTFVNAQAETLEEVNNNINEITRLSKAEVIELITDKEIEFIMKKKSMIFTHNKDGVLKAYIPKKDHTFYGKWWVKNNGVLCKKTNKKRCSLIAKSKEGNYYAYIHKKKIVFAKIIVK